MTRARIVGVMVFLGVAAVLVYVFFFWLSVQAEKVRWAIDLVGGEQVLRREDIAPEGDDKLYMESLFLSADAQMYETIRGVQLCIEMNDGCVTRSLAVANFLLIHTVDIQAAVNAVEVYRYQGVLQAGACPAKYELSSVVKEVNLALALPASQATQVALERIEQIKRTGGLVFSLRSEACNAYFSAHPYIARGYLAHLALLMSVAQGKFSPQWTYLLSRPGVYSVIK
ncbi:hypothetical protein [Pseudomonas sp. CFBP 5748]